ncbi:hypothetical protein LNP24_04655 [Klebsiella pneumoniae subsp. pneumoniae]|nr:hypothetical protein [Klebsiella pneumoniae subsp. pneumoniae]
MTRRDALVRGGFAFEYSATFGQAVAKGLIVEKAEEEQLKSKWKLTYPGQRFNLASAKADTALALSSEDKRRVRIIATREIYAKCILFDYSYKFFYEDGYGKESLILNMNGDAYGAGRTTRASISPPAC